MRGMIGTSGGIHGVGPDVQSATVDLATHLHRTLRAIERLHHRIRQFLLLLDEVQQAREEGRAIEDVQTRLDAWYGSNRFLVIPAAGRSPREAPVVRIQAVDGISPEDFREIRGVVAAANRRYRSHLVLEATRGAAETGSSSPQ